MKKQFNKEFEEVLSQKEAEVSRTRERNTRMAKIIRDLELNETVYHPKMSSEEQPELLLKVEDHEVRDKHFAKAALHEGMLPLSDESS